MRAVSISSLRARMREYFDAVTESSEILIVPRNNRDEDAIVIMSIGDYNSLMETEHLLSSKKNAERLEESIRQLKAKDTKEFPTDKA